MKRWIGLASAGLVLGLAPALVGAAEPKTLFDHIESSYVFGEVQVAKPLHFREDTLLVYSTTVTDLMHARIGKPRQLMLVQELSKKDDKRPFEAGESFVAPIALLPEYSYWRDNLPKTPHHQVLGGNRYIFKGAAEIEEVKRIARPFAATLARKRAERWVDQCAAVVEGLTATVAVLREDSSRYLANNPVLLERMPQATLERLASYLGSDAAEAERLRIIDAIGTARVAAMAGMLEPLGARDDTTGAAALRARERLGKPLDTAKLAQLTAAKSEAVRAYAAEALGARAAEDREAFAKASALLSSSEPPSVRAGAAVGLGKSRAGDAVAPLGAALAGGDDVARPAAAAIASIGGEEAADALKKAITDGKGESGVAAVLAIVNLQSGCPDCEEFLEAQHESNPNVAIREMIEIVLELEKEHAH